MKSIEKEEWPRVKRFSMQFSPVRLITRLQNVSSDPKPWISRYECFRMKMAFIWVPSVDTMIVLLSLWYPTGWLCWKFSTRSKHPLDQQRRTRWIQQAPKWGASGKIQKERPSEAQETWGEKSVIILINFADFKFQIRVVRWLSGHFGAWLFVPYDLRCGLLMAREAKVVLSKYTLLRR